MKLSTIAIAGLTLAGSATFTVTSASAAQVFESYTYSSSTNGADFADLYVTNNDSAAYTDVTVNGADLGSLAVGATTAAFNFGDPSEGGPSTASISISAGGQTATGSVAVIDYDVNKAPTFAGDVVSPVSAAPEPATWALMLAGVGVLGASLRSTRRRVLSAA